MMRHVVWSAVALAVGTIALVVPAVAQDVPVPATGGPPSWVQAGIRISHSSSVASVDSRAFELIEDPNGPLEDPATGKRYRESFSAGSGHQGSGGAGEGILEATVMAIEGTDVILARALATRDPLNGGFSAIATSGERMPGATVPGLWMHPDALTSGPSEGSSVRVLRGETALGGVTYQSVTLVNPTPGAYSSFTYDQATGVLLTSALRISGGPGSTAQMSTTELLGVRQMVVPGIGASVPEWLARRATLGYAGSTEMVNPMDPSGFAQTYPLTTTVSFPETGATWARYQTDSSVDLLGSPVNSSGTGAVGGAGPYWWDSAALAGFTTGQVLDTDPHTGLALTVSETGQGPLGPAVAITGRMPGFVMEAFYDLGTGVMLGQAVSSASSGITNRLQLQQLP